MDRLSIEVLSSIFIHLHYEQKKQCKLVCRSWAQALASGGLEVETVMLPLLFRGPHYSLQTTHNFVTKVPNKVGCKRLSLCQFHDKARLATLFPNLKFLAFFPEQFGMFPDYLSHYDYINVDDVNHYKDSLTGRPRPYTNGQIEQLANWHDRLETLIDIHFSCPLFVFLDTGLFCKLTTLILSPDTYSISQGCGDILFDMLKNTPNLKLLQLRYFPITTYHLEKLHANVPHLETLRICDFAPDSNNRAEPSLLNNASLKPALLKRLDLEINRFRTNFLPAFLDYILLKYPSLQEFDFAVPYGGIGDAWESFFPHLLRSTKNTLTKFKVNTYTESPNLISLLKDHAIFTLTTLELNLFDDQQQEEHKKIHDIIDFVQDGNIQSLSLTDIPDIDFGVFQKLDKLKELKLAFRSEQTHNTALHRVVQELPQSLETFSLSKAHIYLKQQEEPVISGIKRLELLECQVQSDLSDFLSNQLPLLDAFILRTSQMMFNLRLRHAHLSLVDIYITQGAWKYTVHDVFVQPQKYFICHPFKATVGKKTSVYYHPYEVKIHMNSEAYFKNLFDVHDHSMYYFYKASTVPLQYGQPHFHFQCESVHTFLYNDCLIFV